MAVLLPGRLVLLCLALWPEVGALRLSSSSSSPEPLSAVRGEGAPEVAPAHSLARRRAASLSPGPARGRAPRLSSARKKSRGYQKPPWPQEFRTSDFRVAILLVGDVFRASVPVTTTTTSTTTLFGAPRASMKRRRRRRRLHGHSPATGGDSGFTKRSAYGKGVSTNRSKLQKGSGSGKEHVLAKASRAAVGAASLLQQSPTVVQTQSGTPAWWVPPELPDSLRIKDNNKPIAYNISQAGWNSLVGTEYWPWASLLHYVRDPLTKVLGRHPDIFLCTRNILGGSVPLEITDTFDVDAPDQFQRLYACFRKLADNPKYGRYDYYIKARPDFIFTSPFPDITSMHPQYMHSRFREAMGLPNLTSAHFSWCSCTVNCNGWPYNKTGYTNDDQIFVVSWMIADKVFINETFAWSLRGKFEWPKSWIHTSPNAWESLWSKGIAAQGVLTEPIALQGYPTEAKRDHQKQMGRCLFEVLKKNRCGHKRSLPEAHQNLIDAVMRMNGTLPPLLVKHRRSNRTLYATKRKGASRRRSGGGAKHSKVSATGGAAGEAPTEGGSAAKSLAGEEARSAPSTALGKARAPWRPEGR